MPTNAENAIDATTMSGRTSVASRSCAAMTLGAEHAEREPDEPAQGRQRQRLDEELQQDVARLGADRHAQADLARALGDR